MFVVNGSDLTKSINKVLSVVSNKDAKEQLVFFKTNTDTQTIELSGQNDLYSIKLRIKADIKKVYKFALTGSIAAQTFNNKGLLTFFMADTALNFKAEKGVFKGTLFTQDFEVVKSIKKKSAISVDAGMKNSIFTLLKKSSLVDCHDSSQILIASIRSNKTQLKVIVADTYHTAYVTESLKNPNVEFDIPVSYIHMIERIVGDNNFEIQFDQSCINIFNDDLDLSLPQTGARTVEINDIENFIKDLSDNIASASVDSTDIQQVLKNMESIRDDDSGELSIQIVDKKIVLDYKSKHGKLSFKIKCVTEKNSDLIIKLDPRLVNDCLTKLSGMINVKIVNADVFCFEQLDKTKNRNFMYLMAVKI